MDFWKTQLLGLDNMTLTLSSQPWQSMDEETFRQWSVYTEDKEKTPPIVTFVEFFSLPMDKRSATLQHLKLCLNCLGEDHFVKSCNSIKGRAKNVASVTIHLYTRLQTSRLCQQVHKHRQHHLCNRVVNLSPSL